MQHCTARLQLPLLKAASAALIEKVRTATTDGGESVPHRSTSAWCLCSDLQLAWTQHRPPRGNRIDSDLLATVNADIRVGTVEETVTVTGESQSWTSETLNQKLESTTKWCQRFLRSPVLQLGGAGADIATQGADVRASAGPAFAMFRNRGVPRRRAVTGSGFPTGWQGQGVSYYVADLGAAEEVTFALTGGLGEYRVSGPIMNVVPRSGGNQFRGSVYANGAGGGMEGSNFTQAHRDAGLRAPNQLDKIWM